MSLTHSPVKTVKEAVFPWSTLTWTYDADIYPSGVSTIYWDAGNLRFSNDITYAIDSGVEVITGTKYIYWDVTSSGVFQWGSAVDCVGTGIVPIGVSIEAVESGQQASLRVFQGPALNITADNIATNTLSAITADLGYINAGDITGVTITGGLIQTSSGTTQRVTINEDDENEVRFYNDSNSNIMTVGTNVGGSAKDGVYLNNGGIVYIVDGSNNSLFSAEANRIQVFDWDYADEVLLIDVQVNTTGALNAYPINFQVNNDLVSSDPNSGLYGLFIENNATHGTSYGVGVELVSGDANIGFEVSGPVGTKFLSTTRSTYLFDLEDASGSSQLQFNTEDYTSFSFYNTDQTYTHFKLGPYVDIYAANGSSYLYTDAVNFKQQNDLCIFTLDGRDGNTTLDRYARMEFHGGKQAYNPAYYGEIGAIEFYNYDRGAGSPSNFLGAMIKAIWSGENAVGLEFQASSSGTLGTRKLRIVDSGIELFDLTTINDDLDVTGDIYCKYDNSYYTIFSTDSSGNLSITPNGSYVDIPNPHYIRASYGQDVRSYFGNAAIGYTGHTGYASFSHYLMANSTNYAVLQNYTGETYLNAKTGYGINFRINNSNIGDFDVTGFNVVGQYEMDGSAIITTSGYQTGVLKTRSYLAFGHDQGDTINDEAVTLYPYMAGNTNTTGVANGMGYRMPRAGKITGVSMQFDISNTSSDAEVTCNVYLGTNAAGGSSSISLTSPLVSCSTTDMDTTGDVGCTSTSTECAFSADQTINCRVEFSENAADTCAIENIAILIEIAT